jgi:hypothetical protein
MRGAWTAKFEMHETVMQMTSKCHKGKILCVKIAIGLPRRRKANMLGYTTDKFSSRIQSGRTIVGGWARLCWEMGIDAAKDLYDADWGT